MTVSKIYMALSLAQSQMRGAVKENTNPHFKSRYADLESVIDAIRKPLADNELAFLQSVSDGYIHTIVIHSDGGQLVSTVPFVCEGKDMQKIGAALTYARRQGLCTAFGVPQVDDDGNYAAQPLPAPKPVVKAAVKPAPVEKIPPGLLTDGPLHDEPTGTSVPFKADPLADAPQTRMTKEMLEKCGLTVEVSDIYPLFVEGRDNELVKMICREAKIPNKTVETHRFKLKEYLLTTQNEVTLHDAVINYFTNNK